MFGWRIERTSHIDLKGRLQKTQSLRSSHPGGGIDRIETRSSPKGSFAKSRRNYVCRTYSSGCPPAPTGPIIARRKACIENHR